MKIGFFGRLAERMGREIDLDSAPSDRSVADVRRRLADLYPESAGDFASRTVRACVDDAIVPDSHVVRPGQRIEFLPPLSGG